MSPTYLSQRVRDLTREQARCVAVKAADAEGVEVVAATLSVSGAAVRSWGSRSRVRPNLALAEKILREYGAKYGARS